MRLGSPLPPTRFVVICSLVATVGCFESYLPGGDTGRADVGTRDVGTRDVGADVIVRRDSSPPDTSPPDVGPVDSGPIEPACRRVCPHIVECGIGTLRECRVGCRETEAEVRDPECRLIFLELVECIGDLECDEIPRLASGEPLFEETRCADVLFEFGACIE